MGLKLDKNGAKTGTTVVMAAPSGSKPCHSSMQELLPPRWGTAQRPVYRAERGEPGSGRTGFGGDATERLVAHLLTGDIQGLSRANEGDGA